MSVPTKPTETLTWAESGSPPSAPGSNLPSEPSAGRKATGYGFQEPLPHDEHNWMLRTVNRWLKWVTEKMDLHVHDGGTDPESVAKIDLKDHIDYGTNGFFEVTQDTGAGHFITHKSDTSAPTRLTSDVLRTENLLITNEIRPKSGTVVSVTDPLFGLPQVPVVALNTIKARAAIKSDRTFFGNSRYGFTATIAGITPGLYELTLESPPGNATAIVAVATLNTVPAGGERVAAYALNASTIQVLAVDSSGAALDVSVMVMYTV